MGGAENLRNKAQGNIPSAPSLICQACQEEADMADEREKISTGPNDRPINETIAGTGPGIPDEALTPEGELPRPPTAAQEKRIRQQLGAPEEEVDTLPLDGE
jgi:hypothetical protein